MVIFGWVSLTRLKFNTSFFWSYKNRHRLLFWLVMSQVTDLMCKYAHNCYFNNWSGDNASNKITCSLWDTLCILESLFWTLSFLWHSLSPGFKLFLTKCGRKTKSHFEEKLSPGVLDLVNFFQTNNFSFFEKMLWGSGAIFFETFWFAPRKKVSRWKNLSVFQRLMFCTS